jgi:hypothetical protein
VLTGRVLVSGVAVLAVTVLTTGCGSNSSSSDTPSTASPDVAAATQTAATTATVPSTATTPASQTTAAPPPVLHTAHVTSIVAPRLPVEGYFTRASVPQVTGLHNAAAANKILLATVTRDEQAFAPKAKNEESVLIQANEDMQGANPVTPNRVTYAVLPTTKLVAARPGVVSALIPVARGSLFQPEDYVSATIDMKTGKQATFDDLFKDPATARRAIAHAATDRLYATNTCIKHTLPRSSAADLRPKPANYRQFALLPRGVTFGFSGTQTLCGRVAVALPYSVVRAHLTPLGKRLLAAAGGSTNQHPARRP